MAHHKSPVARMRASTCALRGARRVHLPIVCKATISDLPSMAMALTLVVSIVLFSARLLNSGNAKLRSDLSSGAYNRTHTSPFLALAISQPV